MSYIVRKKAGIAVMWTDGYLPSREELIKNIKDYPNSRPEFNPSQLDYEPESDWPRDRIFESAATLIISDFHNQTKIYQPPCSIWLAKLYDENNSSMSNVVAETRVDSFREDYRHVITVHNTEGAKECLAHLLDNIRFKIKDDDDYVNYTSFSSDCERAINEILEVFTSPHLAVINIFGKRGFSIVRYTR